MITIAARIIDFIGNLYAMDRLHSTPNSTTVIDLESSLIYEESADWPDGERLSVELHSGKRLTVATHKLVQHLMVRHANAMSTTEKTSIRSEYDHVSDHFIRKTGFGE